MKNLMTASEECLSTLQRNSFLAHPELMLISMAGDENPSTRRRAADLIRKVMDKPRRKYVLPKLRQSEEYENMIDFEASTYGVPSLLVDWDLSSFQKIRFEDIPSHTQGVERMVQETAKAASSSCTTASLDRILRSREEIRSKMPLSMTKKDWLEFNKASLDFATLIFKS